MVLYPSRVNISVDHNERNESGKPTYLLTINVKDPYGFPPYLDGTNPHCCFVYERSDPNSTLNAKLLRIATLDDIKTLPTDIGFAGGGKLFRSNMFSAEYTSDSNMLLEKETIFRSLYVLYQNIATLYSELVNTKQHEQYLLPDGYHDQVDQLIQQLLNYRAAKTRKEELYKAILDITIPAFQNEQQLLTQALDIANQLSSIMNDESTNVIPKLTAGLIGSTELQGVFAESEDYLTEDNARKADTTGLAVDIKGLIASLPADETTEAVKEKADAIVAKMEQRPSQFVTLSKITSIRQNMSPAMTLFRQIDATKIVALTNISNLIALIDNRRTTLKKQLSAKQTEADALQLDIETTKSNIQTIEGRLKVLMPSIDLNNPDNKWSIQIQIQPKTQTGGEQ